MSPQVVAAIIAAGISFLTLIVTVAAQILGRRATSRDTEKALDRTLGEQRVQLDKTLAEQRTRTLNERFATAADQLGSDKPSAVRLAGVYAMAGLADDWAENRRTCVDVLCAYLRMPYEPDPGDEAPAPTRLAFRADREVRHTVIRVITAHLKEGAAVSWQGLNFDFTGVVFDLVRSGLRPARQGEPDSPDRSRILRAPAAAQPRSPARNYRTSSRQGQRRKSHAPEQHRDHFRLPGTPGRASEFTRWIEAYQPVRR